MKVAQYAVELMLPIRYRGHAAMGGRQETFQLSADRILKEIKSESTAPRGRKVESLKSPVKSITQRSVKWWVMDTFSWSLQVQQLEENHRGIMAEQHMVQGYVAADEM
ncbi:hypothetical protein SRHO_G00226290 [Serrasalmus rhombeus]